MHGNRLLVMEALVKVFALEHLRDRVFRCQTYEILGGELREPPAVEVHHRFFRAENLENLRLVGLGVLRNLLPRQRRPRRRAPRWIAYHSGEISDEEDDRVAEVLKMFELAQQDRVPQVQIGSGWIEARLHPQRFARSERTFEFGAQFGFLNNLRRALLDVCQLFVNRWKVSHVVSDYIDPSAFPRAPLCTPWFKLLLLASNAFRKAADRSSAPRLPAPASDSAAIPQTPRPDQTSSRAP